MSYNYNVTITVPKSQAATAAKVGMCMDPDSGGAASWSPEILGYTAPILIDGMVVQGEPIFGDTIFVSTPCQKEFHDQVPVLLANPALLHYTLVAALKERFPDVKAPTLEEVEAFCASVIPEPVADATKL